MAAKTPTMRDVAELAGVSVQTVSCVVNSTGSISPATRRRVLKAIDQLNYRRDPIARSMRTRQTGLIGLLVLDITNPVHSTIASAVESAAYTQGYKVVLYNVSENAERERESLEASAEGLVDGLIIVNSVDRDYTLQFLPKNNLTAVLIDCLANAEIPSVRVDNVKAAYTATCHLTELGHCRIAHLAGSVTQWIARHRIEGYRQALAEHHLSYQQVMVSPLGRWDYQAGYSLTCDLLQQDPLPTAIFAASDQMAIGAYRAIAEAGLRVPDDLSVVGFDDIEAAAFVVPPLTTIRQPFDEIAANAVSLLMELIGNRQVEETQLVLPPEMIIRGSTAEVSCEHASGAGSSSGYTRRPA